MSVNDYCQALNNESIIVNQDYQRNSGLWTSPARSFFIESILLEYPIPKIYLYANVDLSTRKTIKEIVDGQQRSHALQLFYNNRSALSSRLETEELRGKKYRQLPGEYQSAFLTYQLPIDQFSGVPDSEVRESFRRMNSSNVPLNDEEQRNAKFQGPFKWFIYGFGRQYNEALYSIGVFSKRDLARMADTRTYADIAYAIESGIATTRPPELDGLYRTYNSSFESEALFGERMGFGFDQYLSHGELHTQPLLRAHLVQTFVLLFIETRFDLGLTAQATELAPEAAEHLRTRRHDLEDLIAAIAEPEDFPELATFAASSRSGTNVSTARAIRFLYFQQAIELE
jgi:hypothetical protein